MEMGSVYSHNQWRYDQNETRGQSNRIEHTLHNSISRLASIVDLIILQRDLKVNCLLLTFRILEMHI